MFGSLGGFKTEPGFFYTFLGVAIILFSFFLNSSVMEEMVKRFQMDDNRWGILISVSVSNFLFGRLSLTCNLYCMFVLACISSVIYIEKRISGHVDISVMSMLYCCRMLSAFGRYLCRWIKLNGKNFHIELLSSTIFIVFVVWNLKLSLFWRLLTGAAFFHHVLINGRWANIAYLSLFVVLFFTTWRFLCFSLEQQVRHRLEKVSWFKANPWLIVIRILVLLCFAGAGAFAFTHMLLGAWLLLFCRGDFNPDIYSFLAVEGMKGFLRLRLNHSSVEIFSIGIYEAITSGWGTHSLDSILYYATNEQIANNTVLVESFSIWSRAE